MKRISILGSTGSIGTQAIEIIRDNPDLKVVAISGNSNIDLLEKQILEFSPKLVCVYDKNNAETLKMRLSAAKNPDGTSFDISGTDVVHGMDGLMEVASFPDADIVLTAVVGMIGIRPTMAAIEAGKDIALANKETLVCAGHIIMKAAEKHKVKILPVDSEHSAIFQSLNGEGANEPDKILLTASGGPFRGKTREELENADIAQALNHPNWKMGKKVTIDSSTLANKGLEVMEARWLFDVPPEKIQVLVHPQSIVHSAVQFKDGAIIAQLGTPDMKIPIQYAFFYPERRFLAGKRVDLFELGSLTFEKPDIKTFKALKLAYAAIERGGSLPVVFNAANEKAVKLFLDGEIKYLEIGDIIEKEMNMHKVIENPRIDEIIEIGEKIMGSRFQKKG